MTLFADKSINIFSEKSIQKKYVFFIHYSYFLGRKRVTFPRLFELKVKNFVYVLYTSSKTQINRIMGSFKVRLIVLILYTFNGLVNIYFFRNWYTYLYTDYDDLIIQPLAPPPQTHTSDRPIFKISFDSENSGKLMRHYVAISLIFAF